jgi:Na+-transporting methylmalonyl-CoA/oxaloacetate decarboxylase gamma subunit
MRPFEAWMYGGGIVFAFMAILSLGISLVTNIQKQKIVEERRSVQAQIQKTHAELLKQSTLVESQFFVEREAREKLGLGREGESVVLLPDQPAAISSQSSEVVTEKKSNIQMWWELFF